MKSLPRIFARPCLVRIALLVLAGGCIPASGAPAIEELRNLWKEWSRVKGTISEERNVWAREQQSIADALAVSRQEIDLLSGKLAHLDSGSTGTEKQRAELLDRIAASKATLVVFAENIEKYEGRMRELLPVLPNHLKTELAPLLQRLPVAGKPTSMPVSQRMQTVIAFLAQLDKFNAGPSLVSEVKEVESGKSLEVRTLYFGMGSAYFTDAAATHAGTGSPGPEGWKWTPADASTAKRIAEAISVYLDEKHPVFVSLPVQLR